MLVGYHDQIEKPNICASVLQVVSSSHIVVGRSSFEHGTVEVALELS